ncbi:hypothetical protein OQA88_11084 [Cercophora sp. LCS_1]
MGRGKNQNRRVKNFRAKRRNAQRLQDLAANGDAVSPPFGNPCDQETTAENDQGGGAGDTATPLDDTTVKFAEKIASIERSLGAIRMSTNDLKKGTKKLSKLTKEVADLNKEVKTMRETMDERYKAYECEKHYALQVIEGFKNQHTKILGNLSQINSAVGYLLSQAPHSGFYFDQEAERMTRWDRTG